MMRRSAEQNMVLEAPVSTRTLDNLWADVTKAAVEQLRAASAPVKKCTRIARTRNVAVKLVRSHEARVDLGLKGQR